LEGGLDIIAPVERVSTCLDVRFGDVNGCWAKMDLLRNKRRQYLPEGAYKFVDIMIPAVTVEKQLRATLGELPHDILHLSFVFYFGGSAFILCAIAISAFKVLAIRVILGHVLPSLSPKYGCSSASLQMFHDNAPHIYLFDAQNNILKRIEKFNWKKVKRDLVRAGMSEDAPDVTRALEGAMDKGMGRALREKFEAFGQETNFVLVEAIRTGNAKKVSAVMECGFDPYGAYSSPDMNGGRAVSLDTLISWDHAQYNEKGQAILTNEGKALMRAIGRQVTDDKED